MKSEDVKALVSHRMEKSKESIKAAEIAEYTEVIFCQGQELRQIL